MANTIFQLKRSTVSGVTPTTVDIVTGELGINVADKKLFSSNGTVVFELGSNLASLSVTGTASVAANLTIGASGELIISNGAGIYANGSLGSNGQVLTSNASGVFWGDISSGPGGAVSVRETFTANSTVNTTFTVTGGYTAGYVDVYYNGSKLVNGIDVQANDGTTIVLSSAAPIGTVVDVVGLTATTLLSVNTSAQYAWTNTQTFSNTITFSQVINGTANNANNLGGISLSTLQSQITGNAATAYSNGTTFSSNASNITTGTLANARLDANVVNTSAAFTITGIHTYQANILMGNTTVNTQISNATILISNATSTTTFGLTDLRIGNTTTNVVISNTTSAFGGNVVITGTANVTANLVIASTSDLIISNGAAIQANGTFGTSGQVLTSNATGVYWSTPAAGSSVNTVFVDAKIAAYTLASTDSGYVISTNAAVTVNGALLSSGFIVTVFNNSAANVTITSGAGATIYLAGTASTGNRTLAQRGLSTLTCISANVFVISGAGIT